MWYFSAATVTPCLAATSVCATPAVSASATIAAHDPASRFAIACTIAYRATPPQGVHIGTVTFGQCRADDTRRLRALRPLLSGITPAHARAPRFARPMSQAAATCRRLGSRGSPHGDVSSAITLSRSATVGDTY